MCIDCTAQVVNHSTAGGIPCVLCHESIAVSLKTRIECTVPFLAGAPYPDRIRIASVRISMNLLCIDVLMHELHVRGPPDLIHIDTKGTVTQTLKDAMAFLNAEVLKVRPDLAGHASPDAGVTFVWEQLEAMGADGYTLALYEMARAKALGIFGQAVDPEGARALLKRVEADGVSMAQALNQDIEVDATPDPLIRMFMLMQVSELLCAKPPDGYMVPFQ